MAYNYTFAEYNKEHMARGVGRGLPISVKVSIEICNTLRKMPLANAKTLLSEVLAMRKSIKYKRFTNGIGHRRGTGVASGRYPQKATQEILNLLESTEANAQFKGMNTSSLIIRHISAQNAGNQWRYGRHKRMRAKRTHLEVVLEEGKADEKKPAAKKAAKPAEKKEVPKAAPKVVPKETPKEPIKEAPKKEQPKPAEVKKEEAKPAEVKKEAPKEAPKMEQPKPEPNKEQPKPAEEKK